jgi:hypothetical protein
MDGLRDGYESLMDGLRDGYESLRPSSRAHPYRGRST